MSGIRPLGKAGKNFRAQIVGADLNMDFAFRRSMQIAGADDFALLDEDDGVTGDFDFA